VSFSSIPDAIDAIRRGEFVVVADDEDRENEGDLIMAAELTTPERIAFMVRHTTGIICAPLLSDRLDQLRLPQMVPNNTDIHRTAFTVSVDYVHGTSTGVSAVDRSATLRALASGTSKAEDFARPGHIFPLRYAEGGVLRRAGHTEASVDLARAAGLAPAGVLCELTNDDGTMKRVPELVAFAKEHNLHLITIADLIEWRRRTETLIQRGEEREVQTPHGAFRAIEYVSIVDGSRSLALVYGDVKAGAETLVRMHVENVLGDAFGGSSSKASVSVDDAMKAIAKNGSGVLVYLRAGGALIGSSSSPPGGEWREHGLGAQILVDLGVKRLRVLTNSSLKYAALQGYGLEITGHQAG
jgi:3,4-dihydroxy 2-butanone 4-phosphate synthase/GTP cyclohydrolase II